MLLLRFVTHHPWIFTVFGLMIFALAGYSNWDAQRGGSVVPFEQLEVYSGKIITVTKLGEGAVPEPDGGQRFIYYQELSILESDGEKKTVRVLLNEVLPLETYLTVHEDEEHKVHHLVVDGRVLIDYKKIASYAAKRAQAAQETMMQTQVLVFGGLLVLGGLFAQVRVMRKRARVRQQYSEESQLF